MQTYRSNSEGKISVTEAGRERERKRDSRGSIPNLIATAGNVTDRQTKGGHIDRGITEMIQRESGSEGTRTSIIPHPDSLRKD